VDDILRNAISLYLIGGFALFIGYVAYVGIKDKWDAEKHLPFGERILAVALPLLFRVVIFIAGVGFWLNFRKGVWAACWYPTLQNEKNAKSEAGQSRAVISRKNAEKTGNCYAFEPEIEKSGIHLYPKVSRSFDDCLRIGLCCRL
jgi:hypothetical protein